jgi:hypothetical protein
VPSAKAASVLFVAHIPALTRWANEWHRYRAVSTPDCSAAVSTSDGCRRFNLLPQLQRETGTALKLTRRPRLDSVALGYFR